MILVFPTKSVTLWHSVALGAGEGDFLVAVEWIELSAPQSHVVRHSQQSTIAPESR